MPDISLCVNTKCPLRGNCYRYRAIPDALAQSFALFEPKNQTECEYHWPIAGHAYHILSTDEADRNNKRTKDEIDKLSEVR